MDDDLMGGPKSLYKESDELLLIILKAPFVFFVLLCV